MASSKNMTEGNIAKALIMFTLPMLISVVFQQLYNLADSVIAGYISLSALTAVGTVGSVAFLYVAIGNGFASGSAVLIAKYFGSKDYKMVKTAITTAIISIIGISSILTIVGIVFKDAILTLINTQPEVFEEASDYLSIYMYGLTFLFLYNIVTGVFTSLGNSKVPLFFLIASVVLNIFLDYTLGIKLGYGVKGLAFATVGAEAFGCILSLLYLVYTMRQIKVESYKKFDYKLLGKLSALSLPNILQQSVVSVGQASVQGLINSFGLIVAGGFTAASKVGGVFCMAICTVSTAISKFVGQNFGAKKYDRIEKAYKIGNIITGVIALVSIGTIFFFSTNLLKLFGGDTITSDVVSVGNIYLYILAPGYIFLGLKVVPDGCVQGCLKMKAFVIGTFVDLFARVVFSYALAPSLGFTGICIAFSLGWVLGSIASIIVYKVVVVDENRKMQIIENEKNENSIHRMLESIANDEIEETGKVS